MILKAALHEMMSCRQKAARHILGGTYHRLAVFLLAVPLHHFIHAALRTKKTCIRYWWMSTNFARAYLRCTGLYSYWLYRFTISFMQLCMPKNRVFDIDDCRRFLLGLICGAPDCFLIGCTASPFRSCSFACQRIVYSILMNVDEIVLGLVCGAPDCSQGT